MRILSDGGWFLPVPPGEGENEFETFLLQKSETLFPDFFVKPFKKLVQDRSTKGWRADLVLVDRRFASWQLVEVEMSNHPLDTHVLPQTVGLKDAQVGLNLAEDIAAVFPDLERAQVMDLVMSTTHEVTVIVDRPCPEWEAPLRSEGVLMAVVERFRNEFSQIVIQVSGDMPSRYGKSLTQLKVPRDKMFDGFLAVVNPAPLHGRTSLEIESLHGVETWDVQRHAEITFLKPPTRRNLKDSELVEGDDGGLKIREYKRRL